MAAKVEEQQPLTLSEFQQRVMVTPPDYDLFLGGGRGGGKSFTLALMALRHAEEYGPKARVLYTRRTYKALADFELLTRDLFAKLYGPQARFNQSEHVWRLPNGAYIELGQLEGPSDYGKYQGRSFSLLLIDEAGEWSSPAELDKLRSNLRGPETVPIRTVMAANPGGPGHAWLARRFVFRAAPWEPFEDEHTGRPTIYAPSVYTDNPHISHSGYAAQLRAACATDPELLRAWESGDWSVARGAFFAGVLDENRVAVDPWQTLPEKPPVEPRRTRHLGLSPWEFYLAHDFGSSKPSVTYIIARSPGAEHEGKFYPRGSLVLIDELATSDPDDPAQGLGWPAPMQAEAIKEMCDRWGVRAYGVADDAIFSKNGSGAGSIADEFRRAGVHFQPAKKADRLGGWEVMKRLLADAGKPDSPGLYVARNCTYFWETAPYLGRDKRRVEDLDTTGNDHAVDACRYGCLFEKQQVKVRRTKGF